MTTSSSKVTIHMVASLDGFIAKNDGSIAWMETNDRYESGVVLSDAQITEFLQSIDCYVMGSHTYAHALELGWPYGEVPVIVLTHRKLTTAKKNVRFYSGDLTQLINEQIRPNYKNTWMVGGTEATKEFMRLQLADDLRISFLPVLLGDGKPFFDRIGQEQKLHLKEVTAYKNGMVEMWYEMLKK